MDKGKTYQVPKVDHPWRKSYKGRTFSDTDNNHIVEKNIKSVKILITEFAESWDSMKVVTTAFGREGEFTLSELPQSKQAAWLAGILKRNYAQ